MGELRHPSLLEEVKKIKEIGEEPKVPKTVVSPRKQQQRRKRLSIQAVHGITEDLGYKSRQVISLTQHD